MTRLLWLTLGACVFLAGCVKVEPEKLPGIYKSSADGSTLIVKSDGSATLQHDGRLRQYSWKIVDEEPDCTRLDFQANDGSNGFLPCAAWSPQGGAVISHGADDYFIKQKTPH